MRMLLILALLTASARAAETDATLEAKARAVLREVLATDQTWVRVHAAEALVANGEAAAVRELFLRERPGDEATIYRIGVWRVLANTAPDAADRAAWIARVEQVFLDEKAPDRSQAVETLGKLGHGVTGEVLAAVRKRAAEAAEPDTIMPLWALAHAGEPDALKRLAVALKSPDATVRQRTAYALRWLKTREPVVRRAVAVAAANERADSPAAAYVWSAALTLGSTSGREAVWLERLKGVLANGSAGARYEACQALMHRLKRGDIPLLMPLLDDKDPDNRVAAAWTILHVLNAGRSPG